MAGRLRDRLAAAFGTPNVFLDVESIGLGLDFRSVIRQTINAVDVVLVVIGPRFAPARLADDGDYVRQEIVESIAQRKLVVPVLVENASLPSAADLPADLQTFSYLQAAVLRLDPDFGHDATRLVQGLRKACDGTSTPGNRGTFEASPLASHTGEMGKRHSTAFVVTCIVLFAGLVLFAWQSPGDGNPLKAADAANETTPTTEAPETTPTTETPETTPTTEAPETTPTTQGPEQVDEDAALSSSPWTVNGFGIRFTVTTVERTTSDWDRGAGPEPTITVTGEILRTQANSAVAMDYRISDQDSGAVLERVPQSGRYDSNPPLNTPAQIVAVVWNDVDPQATRISIILHDLSWPDGQDLILRNVPVPSGA